MGTNQELRVLFDQLGSGLELLGGDPYRIASFHRVARVLPDLEDVRELVERDSASAAHRLEALPGIGKGAARRILEYLDTGAIADHQRVLEQVPAGVFELLEVPGLGPKAVKSLWRDLGVTSKEDLRRLLLGTELERLPRMGSKTIENLKRALAFAETSQGRVPLGRARPLAEALVRAMAQVPGVDEAAFAGSVRRGCETIGDLDLLVACRDGEPVRSAFVSLPGVTEVLAQGPSRSSVRLHAEGVVIQADLRIVPHASWGGALLYFTGSKDHNVRLRQIAIQQGKHLNEFGLFRGTEERPQERGEAPLAAATESSIYAELGLPFIPPELREDRGELESGVPEDLVRLEDLHVELHSHTTASDGKLEIAELARFAKKRGMRVLGITEHSRSSPLAGGLDADRLLRHVEAIREADAKIPGIKLLAGAEVDILADGTLDYDDDILAQLDLVIASPHSSLRQGHRAATERLVRAVSHPRVHVLGHPTGRKIGQRQGLEPDLGEVFDAAAAHGTAFEINANWRRLDLRDRHARAALEHGCKLAIDCDVHRKSDFDMLVYGVLTARRAGLRRSDCLNAWGEKKLLRWLGAS